MLSEISQANIICFHLFVEFEFIQAKTRMAVGKVEVG
jgi:hypothetical protein